jgi:hypothetical protein
LCPVPIGFNPHPTIYVLAALAFEFRASHLLGRLSLLEPLSQPFFVMGFFKVGSHELFAQSGFEA